MGRRWTWKKFFHSHLFFLAGLLLMALISVSLTRAQIKDRAIRAEIAGLQQEVEGLEGERARLQDLVTLFDQPEFLEREARRALGYVKPGEKVVVIDKQDPAPEQARCGAGKQDECEMSNPRKWWIYFFGGS